MTPNPEDDLLLRVRRALDQESARREPEFEDRLNAVIAAHHRNQQHRFSRRSLLLTSGGFALAAGLASFFLLPQLFDDSLQEAETAVIVQPAVDPQFLEDMDMVAALGEDPAKPQGPQ